LAALKVRVSPGLASVADRVNVSVWPSATVWSPTGASTGGAFT
jgi:hypothetical protein